MTGPVQVSRDPFARTAIIRETVDASGGCDWCGRVRRSGRLFRYFIDMIPRPAAAGHLFCSLPCLRSYLG